MRTITILSTLMALAVTSFSVRAQPAAPSYAEETGAGWEYARLITLESVVPGGAGRSRMFAITPDGERLEDDLKNYYSLAGINFSNVYENEEKKTRMMNYLAKDGWEIYWIETGAQEGIYTTKYLFRRAK
ncbi:MAG: hypothetical protein WBA12_08380 [Catalinimonas sp.]